MFQSLLDAIKSVAAMPVWLYRVFAGEARYPALLYFIWFLALDTVGGTFNMWRHAQAMTQATTDAMGWAIPGAAAQPGTFDYLGPWVSVLLLAFILQSMMKRIGVGSPFRFLLWVPMFGKSDRVITWPDLVQQMHAAASADTVMRGSTVEDWTGAEDAGDQWRGNIKIGRLPIDPRVELQHFLIAGTTGAGKSQAINAMLRTVRERQQPAIVADVAGGYLSRFGRANSNDIVLNPFDARDAGWNPFLDLRSDYDCERLARATIPDTEGEGSEWAFYAQSLLASVTRSLWRRGEHSVHRLLHLVMAAETGELAEAVKGTAAAPLASNGNEKMLASVRSIASTKMAAWSYLPDHGRFAVRDWVRAVGEEGFDGWLFVTYRDDQVALLRSIVATWFDLAIVETLSLPENDQRRVWFALDELDSLGKVGSLRDGLTKLRKFGGSVISGLQTISQLRDTYGEHTAQTLLSVMNTKYIMRAGDSKTAKYFEEELGQQEVRRFLHNEGNSDSAGSSGLNSHSSSSSQQGRSEQRQVQATVLASEIASLPDLSGYLVTPREPIRKVTTDFVAMEQVVPAYISKDGEE